MFELPSQDASTFEQLLRLVLAEPLALTSVRDLGDAVEVHLADSLAGLRIPEVREATDLADLGSGGGFPGLVLAAALPHTRVVLVESVGKKAAFLEQAARELALANVEVVAGRVEDWGAGLRSVGLVTARALAPLPVLLEYAAPLLRSAGSLVAWKGARDPGEEAAAASAAATLGMSTPIAHTVEPGLVRGARERHLYVSLKVGETPSIFPRRAGTARKRPLGRSSRG